MTDYCQLLINNPEYFKQFSCKDVLFLNYDCPVREKKVAKWSEHHHIFYVLSGKKILHTIDGAFELNAGSIVFVKKGACIVEQFFEESFCVVVFIMPDTFICEFLKDYPTRAKAESDNAPAVISIYDDDMLGGFYQSILPFFTAPDKVPEGVVELKFKELLLYILNNPANKQLYQFFQFVKHHPQTPVKEIMEKNFAYNLSIQAYAKLTNRSISSFKRDFHAAYGTTPGQWLIKRKLEHATKLLMQTTLPVTEVAFESGFENTAHFCRLFNKRPASLLCNAAGNFPLQH